MNCGVPEPWGRGNSVNKEFGGEVLVKEMGLLLDLVDNPRLPLEDLHEKLLYRRHFLTFAVMKIHRNPREREREREWDLGFGGFEMNVL